MSNDMQMPFQAIQTMQSGKASLKLSNIYHLNSLKNPNLKKMHLDTFGSK